MESKKKEMAIKKKYKPIIKPVKANDKKEKKFFDKLSELFISCNIFPFFTGKEIKEIGKINLIFENAFVRDFPGVKVNLLIKKFNVKLEKEFEPNEIYEQKDDKGHFIKLSLINLEHFLLFSYFKWAWQEYSRYWNKITPKNSILNKQIFHLIEASFIDVNANMSHVYSGKYKLHLNHCVCKLTKNTLLMSILIDKNPLKKLKYPSDEQVKVCRLSHSDKKEEDKKEEDKQEEDKKERGNRDTISVMEDYIGVPRIPGLRTQVGLERGLAKTTNNFECNPENKLNKDFVMDIDVLYDEQLDNGNGHEIIVKFDSVDASWKNDWLIDAVILEKIEI